MRYFHFKKIIAYLCGAFLFLSSSLTALADETATDPYTAAELRKSLPIQSNEFDQWPDGPAIGAEGAILMEANTGTILYAKNIDEKLYPASTTKILTCLIGAEECQMDEVVTLSSEAVFSIPRDSSNVGLDVGEQITVEQCLYAILVGSANEAANALAEHVSGSIDAFVEKMNEKAAELGCTNSHFVTTNGLHDENHYTTPHDLAIIAQAFFSNDTLCKMSSTPTYYIPQSATQPDDDLYIHSKNQLYTNGNYAYDYLVGSKTGYTDNARQTLVSCAQKDGMKLICVIMKEESPNQFTDTVSLFDYGFSNFQALNIAANETKYVVDNDQLFQTDEDIFGNSKSLISIDDSDYILLPLGASFRDAQSALSYDDSDSDTIATIQYTYNGMNVGSAKIHLNTDTLTTSDVNFQDASESQPEKNPDNTIFVNVKTVIIWIVCIAGLLIFIFFIKSTVSNYQFSKKHRSKKNRKKYAKGPRKMDDFDF